MAWDAVFRYIEVPAYMAMDLTCSVPQGLFYTVQNLESAWLGCVSFTMSAHTLSLQHVLVVRLSAGMPVFSMDNHKQVSWLLLAGNMVKWGFPSLSSDLQGGG